MEQLILIGEDYLELCQKADKFISDFKEFYENKRSEEENGKDFEKLHEI